MAVTRRRVRREAVVVTVTVCERVRGGWRGQCEAVVRVEVVECGQCVVVRVRSQHGQ